MCIFLLYCLPSQVCKTCMCITGAVIIMHHDSVILGPGCSFPLCISSSLLKRPTDLLTVLMGFFSLSLWLVHTRSQAKTPGIRGGKASCCSDRAPTRRCIPELWHPLTPDCLRDILAHTLAQSGGIAAALEWAGLLRTWVSQLAVTLPLLSFTSPEHLYSHFLLSPSHALDCFCRHV